MKRLQEICGKKKVGDVLNVNPDDLSKGPKDKAAMLGVKEDELNGMRKKFTFLP